MLHVSWRYSTTVLAKAGGDPKGVVADHIRAHKPIIPGIQMDFNSALNCTLLYESRTKIVLVSPDADEKQAARMGLAYATSVQGAIEAVAADLPEATVNVLPMAGVVMPIVPEHMRTRWFD